MRQCTCLYIYGYLLQYISTNSNCAIWPGIAFLQYHDFYFLSIQAKAYSFVLLLCKSSFFLALITVSRASDLFILFYIYSRCVANFWNCLSVVECKYIWRKYAPLRRPSFGMLEFTHIILYPYCSGLRTPAGYSKVLTIFISGLQHLDYFSFSGGIE